MVSKILLDVLGPRSSGIKLCASARSSRLGVGKSSAIVYMACELGEIFGWDLSWEDVMLDAQEYLKRYKEHPADRPSILLLDEISTNVSSRRSMSNANLEMVKIWSLLRSKSILTLCTTPDISMLDSSLRRLLDISFQLQEVPLFHGKAYTVRTTFGKGELRLATLGGPIKIPDMSGHPLLKYLDERKDELLEMENILDFGKRKEEPKTRVDALSIRWGTTARDYRENFGLTYPEIEKEIILQAIGEEPTPSTSTLRNWGSRGGWEQGRKRAVRPSDGITYK